MTLFMTSWAHVPFPGLPDQLLNPWPRSVQTNPSSFKALSMPPAIHAPCCPGPLLSTPRAIHAPCLGTAPKTGPEPGPARAPPPGAPCLANCCGNLLASRLYPTPAPQNGSPQDRGDPVADTPGAA